MAIKSHVANGLRQVYEGLVLAVQKGRSLSYICNAVYADRWVPR
jgi:hypothetical protein